MGIKKQNFIKHVYFIVIILVIVVFIAGILLGKSMSNKEENEVLNFIKHTELNTESYLIEQELIKDFSKDNCNLAKKRITDLSDQLGLIGRQLILEDQKKTLDKTEYDFLKRRYYLMQIRTYFMLNKLMKNCEISENVILYYFSSGTSLENDQGPILDRIVGNYNVSVFTLEHNYSKELSFVESYYGIVKTPTIIINYDNKFEGVTSYEQIANVIG